MTKLEQAARQALEALERWKEWDERTQQEVHDDIDDAAITALREALAEIDLAQHIRPKGKSVIAKMWVDELAEQAEQEPVVKYYGEKLVKGSKIFALLDRDLAPDTLLYAAPVRTKDLTDDEIDAIDNANWENDHKTWDIKKFARAVIAADREKNNANNNT